MTYDEWLQKLSYDEWFQKFHTCLAGMGGSCDQERASRWYEEGYSPADAACEAERCYTESRSIESLAARSG